MGVLITRQRDFLDGCLYVELCVTGRKNAGPDILTPRFPKEDKTYSDPRDCINIAVEIYKQWDKEYGDEQKKLRIIGTQGTLVFDFSTKGITAARAWADRMFANMEKCGSCCKPMGNREKLCSDNKSDVGLESGLEYNANLLNDLVKAKAKELVLSGT